MTARREPVTHEDLAASIEQILAQQATMMAAQAATTIALNALKESVRPLVENTETLKGVAEVTRAATIWRKFLVGALGLLVLIAAAGGVVAGVVLGVKQWIIEGAAT